MSTAAPVPTTRELLTHSRVQCAKTCLRKHYIMYELNIRKIRESEALSEGSAFHAALEAYDRAEGDHEARIEAGMACIRAVYAKYPKWCLSDDDRYLWRCQGCKVAAMYRVHCDRYVDDGYEVVATEFVYRHDLVNPETGGTSRTFDCGGKIDRVVILPDGRVAVQEYKTTSDDIGTDSDYWKKLRIDGQISNYYIGGSLTKTERFPQGIPIETVIYDVTRKSKKQPYRATPLESRKYTKDGRLYANQREEDERPEDYGKRIYAHLVGVDKDTGKPNVDKYFKRVEIARLQSDLEEHKADTWAWGEIIRDAKRKGQWPRNAGACLTYYGRCPYFDLCTSGWSPEMGVPEGFEVLDTQHPELE